MKKNTQKSSSLRQKVLKHLLTKANLYYQQELDSQDLVSLEKQINQVQHDS